MSSVSAFYWFLKCTSPGASGGFAPLTPTGALPLDPTRGPWAGPWTPGRKALATLACSLRIAESDFWDFNVGRYVSTQSIQCEVVCQYIILTSSLPLSAGDHNHSKYFIVPCISDVSATLSNDVLHKRCCL